MISFIKSHKNFCSLFFTQFFGTFNDNFLKNALVILVTYRAIEVFGLGYETLVPLAGGIFIFPFFIFSGTAGQIADRYKKSEVIVRTKIFELLIMLIAGLGFFLDNFYILFFCLFLTGTQSAFFGPLKYGVLPEILETKNLLKGNALISAGTFLAILLGTIIGGGFASLGKGAVIITACLIAISLMGLWQARKIEETPLWDEKITIDYTLFRPVWSLIKLIYRDKKNFTTILSISWFWFVGAAVLSVFPSFIKDTLNGDSMVATLFLGLFTVGMGMGAILAEKLSKGKNEIGLVAISSLGISFCLFLTYYFSGFVFKGSDLLTLGSFLSISTNWGTILSLLFFAMFGGCFSVPLITAVQESAPSEELARYVAGTNILNAVFMVASSVFVLVLANLGPRNIFLVIVFLNLIVGTLFYMKHSKETLKMWARFITPLFYKVEVRGLEHLPKKGPYIVACNHISFVDWLMIMATVPNPVQFVIDWSYYYVKGGPFFFSQAGLVPIATKKENEDVLKLAFKNISKTLSEGSVIGIFPEGLISRDCQLGRFQPGIIKILKKDPVPVYLLSLDGLWGSIFSNEGGRFILKKPKLSRRVVTLQFSEEIKPEEYNPDQARDFFLKTVTDYNGRG